MSLKDLVGEAKAEIIMDDLGDAVEQLKRLGWKEQRPWPEFFAVFKPPEWTANGLEQRLATNFLYYRTNYLILSSGLLLLACVFSPMVLVSVLAVVCFLGIALVVLKGPLNVGEIQIPAREKLIGSIIVSVVFLAVSGALSQLLWAILASIFVCVVHMVFRPRNVHSKMNKQYEEWKMSGFSLGYIGAEEHPKSDPEAPMEPQEGGALPSSSSRLGGGQVRQRGRK